MTSGKRIVLLCLAAVVALLLVLAKAQYDRSRNNRAVSAQPFETFIKATLSYVFVAKQRESSPPQTQPPSGYLVAYEQNPEQFKSDAKLFDTWFTASQLAVSVVEHGPTGNWVKSSSGIESTQLKYRTDPWGHSLCLMRRGDAVLVISGGPSAPSSPVCKDVGMTVEDLEKFPHGKLLQSPSGSLVLVAAKDDPTLPLAGRTEHPK